VISTNPASVSSTLGWDVSYNGNITNGTTTQPLQFTVPSNFIGTNTYWTNWSSLVVNNIRKMQLTTSTNALAGGRGTAGSNTNTVIIAKIVYSYGNQ
jgi:hypothetical protein